VQHIPNIDLFQLTNTARPNDMAYHPVLLPQNDVSHHYHHNSALEIAIMLQ